MHSTLHIATAIDETYVLPLQVTVASLQQHLDASFYPVLYLLNRELPSSQIERIASLIETRTVVVSDEIARRLPRQPGFPPEASFPLLLPNVLPADVDRVLFLDPDLLVLDDISTIWNTELGGSVLAAVSDQAIPTCSSPRGVKDRKGLGIPDDAPYFNAGIMLIDLAKWRAADVSNRVREYLERHQGRTDYSHQEALNAVLWKDWRQLDQRWNLIASLTGRRYSQSTERPADPGIVHFAGRFKPWQVKVGGPFARQYAEFIGNAGFNAARTSPTTSQKLLSMYDRHLRDYLYSIEHVLWTNRLI